MKHTLDLVVKKNNVKKYMTLYTYFVDSFACARISSFSRGKFGLHFHVDRFHYIPIV